MVIPKGLRIYFNGRREVWKSLKTTDKEEASCRSSQWIALGKRLFYTLRKRGRHMTKGQIEALVSNWLEAAFDEAEDHRAIHGHISEAVREDVYYGLSALFDGVSEDLTSGDYRRVAKEADELLQAAHLPALDHASPDFARFCRRLLRAKIEYARVEADRWEGEYEATRGENHKTTAEPIPETQEPSLPFSVVLEKYLAANPRPARTADPMKAEFMRFMEAVGGDKPIATITKADGVTYKESLQLTRKL
ncbi:MAG: hypothetical protein CCU26_00595, partial [Nitrospira sp. UW-LDO-01]